MLTGAKGTDTQNQRHNQNDFQRHYFSVEFSNKNIFRVNYNRVLSEFRDFCSELKNSVVMSNVVIKYSVTLFNGNILEKNPNINFN